MNCRTVSHRGEHGLPGMYENSLAAFDRAADAGVWGIELDIRWTRDLQPVVFHDPDLNRMFGVERRLAGFRLDQLKRRFPLIPTLSEVIGRYAKRLHLMVELKSEAYPEPMQQTRRLESLFKDLIPAKDYHFLALDTAMFSVVAFAPSSAYIAVSELNLRRFSRRAIGRAYGGIAGHYLLMRRMHIERHHAVQQQVGTGYIRSANSLFRELNRGVDWIFSNHAAALQRIVKQHL